MINNDVLRKTGSKTQLCALKSYTFNNGREKGVNVLEANNGIFNFTMLPDKALDIGQVYYKGKNISFVSRNGNYAPQDASFTFANRFPGGMLYTCGLDGLSQTEDAPIHGSLHNIPAEIVSTEDGDKIKVVAKVKQCTLFGQSLTVTRTIETEYGSNKITVCDNILNDGYVDAKYVILYHVNFGYPFLDENTKIIAPITQTVPINEHAKIDAENCLNMQLPEDEGIEKCYYHLLKQGDVCVTSPNLNLKATVNYDVAQLPHLVEWKSMVSGAYALGIEPSSSRFFEELNYKTLKPGESVNLGVTITVEETK